MYWGFGKTKSGFLPQLYSYILRSGSIEMGVTTHDPSEIDFPATMTNLRSGTIMMSGCGILTNGKVRMEDEMRACH